MSSPKAGLRPVYHITPKDDLYKHIIDAKGSCWCKPYLDPTDDDTTYVHNAYDRREDYENGYRLPH